jgi:hypothetical protein
MEGRGESSLSCSSRSQRLIAVGPCVCHQDSVLLFRRPAARRLGRFTRPWHLLGLSLPLGPRQLHTDGAGLLPRCSHRPLELAGDHDCFRFLARHGLQHLDIFFGPGGSWLSFLHVGRFISESPIFVFALIRRRLSSSGAACSRSWRQGRYRPSGEWPPIVTVCLPVVRPTLRQPAAIAQASAERPLDRVR